MGKSSNDVRVRCFSAVAGSCAAGERGRATEAAKPRDALFPAVLGHTRKEISLTYSWTLENSREPVRNSVEASRDRQQLRSDGPENTYSTFGLQTPINTKKLGHRESTTRSCLWDNERLASISTISLTLLCSSSLMFFFRLKQ